MNPQAPTNSPLPNPGLSPVGPSIPLPQTSPSLSTPPAPTPFLSQSAPSTPPTFQSTPPPTPASNFQSFPTPSPAPAPQPIPTPTSQPTPISQPLPTPPVAPLTPPNFNTPTPLSPIVQPATLPDNPASTQSTLLISELRDSLVIMKDGSFRAVVACKSINFDLMSSTEREGVEYSYQNFLNSLSFTTQILIRSQRVDIGPYLERLTEIRRNNDNLLLGVLIDDYINFVDILSQEANIMDKSFFIVIPYYSSPDAEKVVQQTKNFFSSFKKSRGPEITKIDRTTYDKAVSEINNRVESVISGLFQIGIHSVRLNTKELGELYYNFNNPDTAVREPFIDFSKMATTYVKKGEPQNG